MIKKQIKGKDEFITFECRNPNPKNMKEWFLDVFKAYDDGYRMVEQRHSPWMMPLRVVMSKRLSKTALKKLSESKGTSNT